MLFFCVFYYGIILGAFREKISKRYFERGGLDSNVAGGYNFKIIPWNPVSHFIFRKKLLSAGNISIIEIENIVLQ